jgi:transcriptional regulator with GAF, ATPase, and Fis domain
MTIVNETNPSVRLLLDVWREVCRHLDIEESVRALSTRIAGVVPVRRLLVRRIDPTRGRLETVASGDHGGGQLPAVTTPSAGQLTAILAWCGRGRVTVWAAGEDDELRRTIAPPGLGGSLLAGPLVLGGTAAGILLVQANVDLGAHAPLIQALLEPMAVALANDQRLHELARLREAVEADNRALLSRLQRQDITDAVVGAESGLKSVMERVEQVARTDAPVLILGETGSGKEVVARGIHTRSRRANGPFLRINCGAIPPELVDSELFGHERGSFTGAIATRQGWFERADGGTLFLDELGELPPAAQVRLLRVLQDGTFERVGGQRVLNVDVRIVAATNGDMTRLVTEGRFREDLWYRVSVFPIRLPPLRERRQDIAPLAAHFAARAGLRLFGVPLTPNADDIEAMTTYDWPGNVRELAAVIERAAILGDGRHLEVRTALGVMPIASRSAGAPRVLAQEPVHSSDSLDDANRQTIVSALQRTRGRIEGPFGAARVLGINPHTLRSRMRKLGIAWGQYRAPG